MKLLDLNNGGPALVDDEFEPGSYVWHVTAQGYVGAMTIKADGSRTVLLMHRYVTGAPPGTVVDHINGNKLDNQRANLRVTNQTVNQANRKNLNKNNTSGRRGVSYRKDCPNRPWLAQIMVNKKAIYLGNFVTEEEAIAARRDAELQYFGEECP